MPANDFLYLKRCCALVEMKLQWGDSKKWTKADFAKLSEIISLSSGVSISSSTLKRLFGRAKTYKELYQPQLATKNALAHFIGYTDWEDFRSHATCIDLPALHTHINEALPTSEPLPASEALPSGHFDAPVQSAVNTSFYAPAFVKPPVPLVAAAKNKRLPVWINILLISAAIGSGLFFSIHQFLMPPKKKVIFTGKFLKGNTPLEASFYYDISHLKNNTVYLETDYERILLNKQDRFINYVYKLPNLYRVRLITDDEELSTLQVHAISQGWQGIVRSDTFHQPIPRQEICREGGRMFTSEQQIKRIHAQINGEFWVDYINSNEFNADADNYSVETQVRTNSREGGISCFDVELEIIGTTQKQRVRFTRPKCNKWTRVEFSEVRIDGSFTYMPSLTQDLSQWSKISIRVENKTARIYCKDKLVYTTTYQEPAGQIKGIVLRFKGNGSVNYVKLYNKEKRLVYQDNFDEAFGLE